MVGKITKSCAILNMNKFAGLELKSPKMNNMIEKFSPSMQKPQGGYSSAKRKPRLSIIEQKMTMQTTL